nr:reverse transcriptase domain-containing protein [Tanacetum cinerariifolium]
MMAIFHDMIDKTMEVFMDDFSVFGDSFSSCLSHLDKTLKKCEDTNLVLNWEKCHFMVKKGIVLGHKISKSEIEVDRAKVDVIAKLPHLTSVKCVRSFLGHAGFYHRFIQDFSKIARPMTHLLEKEIPFNFSKELGAVLGQRKTKHFQHIHYASKIMTDAQAHYTTTKKELLAVVYAFEKLRPYLVLSKTIVYTNHSALKYLLAKQDAKPRFLRLENPHQDELGKKEITETFPLETLGMIAFRSDSSTSWFADNVEAKALPTNDARVVVKFLKSLFDLELLAFRTAFKTPIGCTPYKLVYAKACHLSIELEQKAYWALKHCNYDLKTAGDHRKVQLNELNKLRDQAYENYLIYEEKTKNIHDSKIKDCVFNVGNRFLLFNSRLKIFSRKLKTRWTGPFIVAHVFPYRTIELSQADGHNFMVNGHRLKHYFRGGIPQLVVPDLQTFPMDQ